MWEFGYFVRGFEEGWVRKGVVLEGCRVTGGFGCGVRRIWAWI